MRIFGHNKEIKRLRGGDLQVAAQANVQIDAEIGQKDHFRMEMSSDRDGDRLHRVPSLRDNTDPPKKPMCTERLGPVRQVGN